MIIHRWCAKYIKWINENIKLHEVEGTEKWSVSMEGKWVNCRTREKLQNSRHCAQLTHLEHKTRTQDPNRGRWTGTPFVPEKVSYNLSMNLLFWLMEQYRPWVRKSRYWRETLQFPHPLLWRNEASLLVHWRTVYFPLALWTLVCVHRVLSAHRPVLLCAQNT